MASQAALGGNQFVRIAEDMRPTPSLIVIGNVPFFDPDEARAYQESLREK